MSTPPVSNDLTPVVDVNSKPEQILNAYMVASAGATPAVEAPLAAAEPVVAPPPAAAEPEDSSFNVNTLPDGRVHVKLETGEEFFGKDMGEIARKISKSKVDTTLWAREMKNELAEIKKQTAPPPVAPKVLTPEEEENERASVWVLNEVAKGLGYESHAEMQSELGMMRQATIAQQNDQVATQFLAKNQDFPNTEDATKELFGIADTLAKQWGVKRIDADLLALAHAQAIRLGKYQPLSKEQQVISVGGAKPAVARPVPTPPIPVAAPQSGTITEPNINMSQKELRALYDKELMGG